jgi:selenoprotein W-related protein
MCIHLKPSLSVTEEWKRGKTPTMHTIEIEYCTGCRWMMRAAWTAQELLTTFEGQLDRVSLIPSATGGTFQVRLNGDILHDRKTDRGFLELKVLKQRLRDHLDPSRDLGHSDSKPPSNG